MSEQTPGPAAAPQKMAYTMPERGFRQVLAIAIKEGWERRDAQSQTHVCSSCKKPSPHSHELHRVLHEALVQDVKASLDMALRQMGEKPKRPLLFGADGETPIAMG